ncbi:hypothetical protein [Flavobacterium xinjiangense]|uniref:Uncharacterized protein n=1 Tax=Flavobacterium xinjiangense TaxID=178356 RepID=A0A1M7P5E8_9FLAO|nr:hypothetical protein [Flavobacterium xinjiangense]SHN11833.1 hypothetical protein SAMN05216269_1148 [Flavobacterium xinjiangense]
MTKSTLYTNNRKAEELGFKMFVLHVENNHFDKIAEDAIKKHEEEILKLKEINKENTIVDSEVFYDILFREEELKALSEMKIIYSYKHFETSLKFLLNSSYKDLDKSKLYKWETISDILKIKKIDIRKLDCFNDIDELREVNNAIKHDAILKSRKIPVEFKDKDHLSYKDILTFYNRVEYAPVAFLKSLHDKIIIDRYQFDENRLEELVSQIEKSMEPKIAIEFANKILSKY